MSDDDEYYEWEEDYPFEDVGPDVVDELAASANYEAILFEDPKFEVEDYLSDWEYYSDDYHDDDPSVKQNPGVASQIDAASKSQRSRPKARTNQTRSSKAPDPNTFQGVIWRTPLMSDEYNVMVQIYEPGSGERVALLDNWREIFKSAQPALDKSRLRDRRAKAAVPAETDFADDELLCEGDEEMDSSDAMSDASSVNNLLEIEDAGDASNTTPEVVESPEPTGPKPSSPLKRGRKRKADVPPVEGLDKDDAGGGLSHTRAKRSAAAREAPARASPETSSAPVRRSARHKK
ncbi:Uncharacterized protein PECH_003604 [Penicillium ucsense]|uniref:Uncharacterized protein n=1 Tax=Penicillium ucsense TaxID=2839758 RepID=A0A8J8VW18_9EURO|nr:Uncharacterized protein PECM_003109 [Penicillium ucsense]KAF7729292.1 Uncharacterized protein PECH_003604 [Penicillium ucsense]